jgi:uncharacterized LabA/DUF88 family protein
MKKFTGPVPAKPAQPRVHAFVDGQNLFFAAKHCFGYTYPNYDPIKLAEAVVAFEPDRSLTQVHFYTGVHIPSENPFWHGFWTNKLFALRARGVRVVDRPLKYSPTEVELPSGEKAMVRVGREKGIDVRLALDLVRLARLDAYDVAIIFSQDTDLKEAVDEVKQIRQEFNRWLVVECAFPVGGTGWYGRGIDGTQWRPINKALYDRCIDPNDYRP